MADELTPKSFILSKTMWLALVAIVPIILPEFGVQWGTEFGQLINSGVDPWISCVAAVLIIVDRAVSKHRRLTWIPERRK